MNEQTTQLLEKLAEKLGTTSEYLWGVLIKQAPMDSVINLILMALTVVLGLVIYRVHKHFLYEPEELGKESIYEEYGPGAGIPMIMASIVFLIMVMGSLFAIESVINGFFNPEYWALQKILMQTK